MNLSYKWLKEFVDIDVDIKEFCDKMTMSGSKVEGYEVEGGAIDKIVTGKVEKIDKHPDADKLLVCSINVGEEEPLQIVTGAKNLKVGDIVPVALDGSTLFDGTKIKKGKLRGILSCGMLCSLAELGLSTEDFPEAVENGIFVLDSNLELGKNIKDTIGYNDTKIEFEITPNRPDCLSVIGLSREAAATFNKKLNLHEPKLKETASDNSEKINVKVEDSDLCPYYSAKVVKNVKIGPSPSWMRARLRTMGVNPINNIVDITNYVMLEYGQPLHAFDLRFIEGNEIIVRKAKNSEKIVTLDGIERSLNEENLIIADSNKPIAIAGVKGGEFSGIMNDSKDIVFESANFFGPSVRKTAKQQNMRTDASALYEKGLDVNNCPQALNRACELVEMLNVGEVTKETFIVGKLNDKLKIKFEPDFINKFLNINITDTEMADILLKIDMPIVDGFVLVPTFRNDIKSKYDLAEEIARFYGYNNIPSTNLSKYSFGGLTTRQKFEEKISSVMLAQGLSQAVTYSFMSPKNFDKLLLSQNSKLRNALKIKNPLGEDTSVMRTTMVASMMEILSRNYNNKNKAVKLFEIAKEYIPYENEELPNETTKLVAGFYGENIDFFDIKGILEVLLKSIRVLDYNVIATEDIEYYHPGRCALLEKEGEVFGYIGEMHPTVCDNYGIGTSAFVFELNIDKIFKFAEFDIEYKSIARFPSVERDLALVCDDDVPVAKLQKVIRDNSKGLLEDISVFDVYKGKQISDGKKSVAFSLSFRSNKETLKDEQINSIMKRIIKAFNSLNIELR